MTIVVMKAKPTPEHQEAMALLREAAAIGPGFHGQRKQATNTQRFELSEKLLELQIQAPPFLAQDHEWIDRQAKLFEAGDYPDKGITVTSETLNRLQEQFELPVPVLIEHSSSPLEIGYLTDVQARGDQLFGTVALTKEANDLIDKSGAHALSLGLSADLDEIIEVSLVKTPRVASARLFTGEVFEEDWKARYSRLLQQVQSENVATLLQGFVQQGRLTPAQLPFARAIMQVRGTIQFDGESVPLAQIFRSFLENSAPLQLFGELAPVSQPAPVPMDDDHRAFYERYFPGLSLEEIVRQSSPALT